MIITKAKMIGVNILCFLAGAMAAIIWMKLFKWSVMFMILAVVLGALGYWLKRRVSRTRSKVLEEGWG